MLATGACEPTVISDLAKNPQLNHVTVRQYLRYLGRDIPHGAADERRQRHTAVAATTRTQIYLTDEQRQKIDKIVEAKGVSLADVVRRALDNYLATAIPDPRPALKRTFGALPDLEVPNRDEWDRG